MGVNQININLPAIKNIAVKGVRRTAVFMGLGINTANNPDFKQYKLADITGLEFIEPISDEKTLTHFKTEFGRWVVGNGLRELIETFCVFLDEIHMVCLLIASNPNKIPLDDIRKRNSKYRHLTFKNKLERLDSDFGTSKVQSPDFLLSINQARNCLTHRRGMVGIEDCLENQQLDVKWIGIDVFAETPSGERTALFPMPKEGVLLPKGGKVIGINQERVKTFPINSIVEFTPRDLSEICLFILNQTNEVVRAVQEYAKNNGIPVT
jgi:hypothetical protein